MRKGSSNRLLPDSLEVRSRARGQERDHEPGHACAHAEGGHVAPMGIFPYLSDAFCAHAVYELCGPAGRAELVRLRDGAGAPSAARSRRRKPRLYRGAGARGPAAEVVRSPDRRAKQPLSVGVLGEW